MDTENELRQFEKDWNAALVRNDADEIGTFLSDDWVIVGSDGITDKTTFLAPIRTGDLTHNRMDSDETHIYMYNDHTAVITSLGTSAGTWKGYDFELREWSSSTCIRRNGKWICVHTMLTEATKK